MNMKGLWMLCAVTLLGTGLSRAQRAPMTNVPPGLEAQLKQFFLEKKAQARALAKEEKQEQAPEIWDFFTAGENGDWRTMGRLYRDQHESIRADPRLKTIVWQPLIECIGAYEQ